MTGKNLPPELPRLRKLSPAERRALYLAAGSGNADFELGDEALLEFADRMVENSVGTFPVPMGIAQGFLINGVSVPVPMATEEPSVIAAASFAAGLIARHGGFTATATPAEMETMVYLADPRGKAESWFRGASSAGESGWEVLSRLAGDECRSLTRYGGGFRSISGESMVSGDGERIFRITMTVGVGDSMGANRLNSLAEKAASAAVEATGCERIMAILSNRSFRRRASAKFRIPLSALPRAARTTLPGAEIARRIVRAWSIARADETRAVTHNKGIMNGVSALALATGNDVRAVESAIHSWACRDGAYRGLGRYALAGESGDSGESRGFLEGELEIPVPLGTVGGAVSVHPVAQKNLSILGNPDGRTLGTIAASLGLAQNFAALLALTGEGIQRGHMALHKKRRDHE